MTPLGGMNMATKVQAELILGTPGRDRYRVAGDLVDVTRPAAPLVAARISANPQNLLIDLHKSAVIVIDMQNDFCHPDGWIGTLGVDTRGAQALAGPINSVTEAARTVGVPVIWLNWGVRPDRANLPPITRYPFSDKRTFQGLGAPLESERRAQYRLLERDGWGAATIDTLQVGAGDIRINKHRISGFWDTPLDTILRNLQARTLFFAGVNSDHCVLGTLMDATFLGYDTVMLEDCVATSSPDFCHQAAIHNVRFCFGFTATSSDVLSGIGAARSSTQA
jgi:ureidoacrylate peracid hydrolase